MTEPHKVSDCCCSGNHDDIYNDSDNDDSDYKCADIHYESFLFNETDEAQKRNLKAKFQ